ncbi:copper amine oxidase N-terminal domain-containing protein [Paenibacillus tepidiphilus]|uniref:copper amine oxidase N-terminal domain-containing protein n=1 Tax=Paenibacillus tepidiphilus TaxID=2608683 RepID=UPI0013A5A1E8|nr:copper amine oxidase N-terminal domain-containing protein [Paenibacillus tepidiphilus]
MKWPGRGLFYGLVLLSWVLTCAAGPAGASPSYRYFMNGTEISGGIRSGGMHLVPLKSAFESLGYEVSWEQKSRTATLYIPGQTIEVKADRGQVKVNGQMVPLERSHLVLKKGTLMIAVKEAAQLTGSRLTVEENELRLESENRFIYGKQGQAAFWIGGSGEIYSRAGSGEPRLIGKVNVELKEWRYAKMSIQPIAQSGSSIVTATAFSGEPLIFSVTVKLFVHNSQVLHSAVSGGDGNPRTAKQGGLWVFAEGGSIRYINDRGAVVHSYNINEWLGRDHYSLEGFAGERLLLIRAESSQLLWVVDPLAKRGVLLYQTILGSEEQASIEKNTDTADMHYGDNLYLRSAQDGLLTFSYFSYLQGAQESVLAVRIADLQEALAEQPETTDIGGGFP